MPGDMSRRWLARAHEKAVFAHIHGGRFRPHVSLYPCHHLFQPRMQTQCLDVPQPFCDRMAEKKDKVSIVEVTALILDHLPLDAL